MKKYLLLLLTMLTTSLGAWADDPTSGTIGSSSSWSYADGNMTITLNATEDITSDTWNYGGNHPWQTYSYNNDITKVTFILGSSVSSVNDNILYLFSQKMTTVKTFDFSSLTDTQVGYFTAWSANFKSDVTNVVKNVILPSGVTIDAVANNFTISGDVITATKLTDTSNIGWSALDGSTLKLTGTISSALDLSGSTSGITVIDLSEATVSANISLNEDYVTTVKVASDDVKQYIKKKDGSTDFDDSKIEVPFNPAQTVTGGSIKTQIEDYLANYTSKSAADITSLTVTGTLSAADVTYLSSLTGLTTLDLSGATLGEGVTKATVNAAVPTGTTVIFPSAYSISGTTVTVDMANALGDDLSTILINAKTALAGSSIGTLIVTGTITNSDLAALADASMTGATRIDLSGATLASGASIDNLRVPTSLTQLVLPEDQTVSSTLATRLAASGSLWYAYSPSSDSQRPSPDTESSYDGSENTIADYVWIVKAGGLAQAFTNEEWLRNSYYIKVASSVALNTTDVNFDGLGPNKPSNYLFLDLSASNLTTEVASSYVVTDDIGYRIILPDNWSNADMAIFAALPRTAEAGEPARGNLAAVYSYEGSKLNILVIENAAYNGTALQNPRIVRSGTDAIEILPGTYAGNHPFGPYSDDNDNDGVTDGIISAINNAQASIKSVIINIGSTANNSNGGPYTFTNPYMTYLSLEGVKSYYNPAEGPNIVISGASSLETLNLKNASLYSVSATGLTSLETVDMTGTIVVGATDLSSNSSLNTLTTSSATEFKGNLNLTSSALTSFSTSAKVTGDIYLNASAVTSVDLSSTQFQNTTSVIHVDKAANEEGTAALDALDKEISGTAVKTIYVPDGFASSTRIHPYAAVEDNIAVVGGSAGGSDSCDPNCTITYDNTTKIASVHITTPGHLADIMATAYASYPIGTTFQFDATSNINLADLKALAGTINSTDMAWRSNYYYVDLYNLPATAALCNTPSTENPDAKGAIYNTIEWLRENNRQFKGLILPKNHTLYGSGTTLIQDADGADPAVATCSEFIAYYKTKEMVSDTPTELTNQLLVAHVYNQSNSSSAYQDSYNKMMSLLDLHTEIETNADIYSISTNSINKINISDLPETATEIEIVNNEMVGTATTANVYVYPDVAGHFATAVNATGLKSTPTELMKIEGPINSDDITAINAFDTNSTADKVNGPRVLDLSAATGVTKALVASLTNKDIEYIILPAGMTKDEVCNNNYSALTSLKAVISTNGTDLVAYVKQAGSLAEARYYATGGSITGNIFTPTQTGLQSVTLAGSLNASDIAANTTAHYVDADGRWASTGGNQSSLGLGSEQGTITTIDLKDAVFTTNEDMNFSYAGLGSIVDIKLPTAESMTLIPENCFYGITSFDDLCIPYNYTHIGNAALYNTYCSHITTTDAQNGAVVDNGPKTYTFSTNLEEIGSDPSPAAALAECVFPQNRGVTDVYVLAHQVPKCYANAFPANMLYGWGGFKGGDFPYCREKYDNSADGSLIFTVLHFPDEASFDASDNDARELSYEEMKKKYTDVNKVYSMKEQTGAVDANGDIIAWPTFSELRRTYNQATNGMTWNDWSVTYDSNHEVNGGDNIPTTSQQAGSGEGDYSFTGYEGWHQFTLSLATYVEPEKNVENNIIVNEYVKTDRWYTFCIPYSITAEQLKEVLGVPASTATVKSRVYRADGVTVLEDECTTGHNPEARTLNSVERKPGTPNEVTFNFTQPLVQDNNDTYFFWNINESSPAASGVAACGNTEKNKVIALRGGLPYIIKPYLPKGVTVKNLGQYVMQRFGKMFTEDQACGNLGTDYYEQLGTRNKLTSRFVKPYEKHKIQAFYDKGDNTSGYYTHTNSKKYNYAFIGQFWEQDLPRYSFYVVNGKWYRYASGNKGYKLAPYKCVIMCSPEDDSDTKTNSGKFRSAGRSNFPTVLKELDDDDIFNGVFNLGFLDGLDDSDFNEGTHSSRESNYIFSLDEDIIEYDENGNQVTSIDNLDGEDLKPAISDGKIYNMAGQYVGKSPEDLSKGMYILNGKKFVVK